MIAASLLLLACGALAGSLVTALAARAIILAERKDAQAELKRAIDAREYWKAEAARLRASLDGNPAYFPRPLSRR